MKPLIRTMIAMAGCMMLAACQNTVNTVENADKHGNPNVVKDSRFVTDGWLRDRLQLRSVKMYQAPNGNMTVEVAATNVRTGAFSQMWSGMTGENPYNVAYKFIWQDENGMTVESNLSIWQTIQIKPGETVFFKSTAPTPQCKDFILNIKEAK